MEYINNNLIINLGQFSVDTTLPQGPEVDPVDGLEITIDRINFELVIDEDFESFDETKKNEFIASLLTYLELSANQIEIVGITPGSVIFDIAPITDSLQAATAQSKLQIENLQAASGEFPVTVKGSSTTVETYHHECELIWASSDGRGWSNFLKFSAGTEISENTEESSIAFFTDPTKWLLNDEGDGSCNYLNLLGDSKTISLNTANSRAGFPDDSISNDFLRHIANEAMGGYAAGAKLGLTDIFSNEDELKEGVLELNEQLLYTHNTQLFKSMYGLSYEDKFSKDGIDNIIIPNKDSSGHYFVDASGIPYIPGHVDISRNLIPENRTKDYSNLGYAIFTKMLNTGGLSRLTNDLITTGTTLAQDDKMSILKAGDTLSFTVKLNPKNNNFYTNKLNSKIYKINVKLQTAIRSLVFKARKQLSDNASNVPHQYFLYKNYSQEIKELLFEGDTTRSVPAMTVDESNNVVDLRSVLDGINAIQPIYNSDTSYNYFKYPSGMWARNEYDYGNFISLLRKDSSNFTYTSSHETSGDHHNDTHYQINSGDVNSSNSLYYNSNGQMTNITTRFINLWLRFDHEMVNLHQTTPYSKKIVKQSVRDTVYANLSKNWMRLHTLFFFRLCELANNIFNLHLKPNENRILNFNWQTDNRFDIYGGVVEYILANPVKFPYYNFGNSAFINNPIITLPYHVLNNAATESNILDPTITSYLSFTVPLTEYNYLLQLLSTHFAIDNSSNYTYTQINNFKEWRHITNYMTSVMHLTKENSEKLNQEATYSDNQKKLKGLYSLYIVPDIISKDSRYINLVKLANNNQISPFNTQYYTDLTDIHERYTNSLTALSNESNTKAIIEELMSSSFYSTFNLLSNIDLSINPIDDRLILREMAYYDYSGNKQRNLLEALSFIDLSMNLHTDRTNVSFLTSELYKTFQNNDAFLFLPLRYPSKLLKKNLNKLHKTIEIISYPNDTPRNVVLLNDTSNNKYTICVKNIDLTNSGEFTTHINDNFQIKPTASPIDVTLHKYSTKFNLVSSFGGGYKLTPYTDLNKDFSYNYTLNSSGNNLQFNGDSTMNPTIELIKGHTYNITLTTNSPFTIHSDLFLQGSGSNVDITKMNENTYYSQGLKHISLDNVTISLDASAQGKTTGKLEFTVPYTAPYTLYYTNNTNYGMFKINNDNTLFDISTIEFINRHEEDTDCVKPLQIKLLDELEFGYFISGDSYVITRYETATNTQGNISSRNLHADVFKLKTLSTLTNNNIDSIQVEKKQNGLDEVRFQSSNVGGSTNHGLNFMYSDDRKAEFKFKIYDEDFIKNADSVIVNEISGITIDFVRTDLLFNKLLKYNRDTLNVVKENSISENKDYSNNLVFVCNKIDSLFTSTNLGFVYTIENGFMAQIPSTGGNNAVFDLPTSQDKFGYLAAKDLADESYNDIYNLLNTYDYCDEQWVKDFNEYRTGRGDDINEVSNLEPITISIDLSQNNPDICFATLTSDSSFVINIIADLYLALNLNQNDVSLNLSEIDISGTTWPIN